MNHFLVTGWPKLVLFNRLLKAVSLEEQPNSLHTFLSKLSDIIKIIFSLKQFYSEFLSYCITLFYIIVNKLW